MNYIFFKQLWAPRYFGPCAVAPPAQAQSRPWYDNTLWFGSVAQPESSVLDEFKEGRVNTINLNKSLADDPRINITMVPLGDGITICRRLY
ncbi:putative class I-like SAM-dependent O-methyltransferase [Helianthus annuus]|nr:putative class I-like SAM-dependent O-methyltransferase [Helianthus annuus]KAJ0540536.1 putative class I-like SAM-dependent O-methyltransferase [Helianthus annuus]KAJ0705680.1 putative class I-like SAM-dependent O-methyltransferase [Helianthus annuus]KAJ0885969.1 putative class I-like SAM-dependent O-methyltransferase [Helianthus annuus]